MQRLDFDSVEEWQEFFNENFPDGVLVTLALSSLHLANFDDSPQFIAPKITVTDLVGDVPEVVVVDVDSGAVFRMDLETVSDDGRGRLLIDTADGREVAFSTNLSVEQLEILKNRREGGLFA
jgi:hypothetical protein